IPLVEVNVLLLQYGVYPSVPVTEDRSPEDEVTTPSERLERVTVEKEGVAPVWMFCGRERVTAPVLAETFTWFVVPVRDVTPVFDMVRVVPARDVPIPVFDVNVKVLVLDILVVTTPSVALQYW